MYQRQQNTETSLSRPATRHLNQTTPAMRHLIQTTSYNSQYFPLKSSAQEQCSEPPSSLHVPAF